MAKQYTYPDQDPYGWQGDDAGEVTGSSAGYFLLVLALVAALVLCIVGFFVARVLLDREPAVLPGVGTDWVVATTAVVPTTESGVQVTVPVTVPPGPPGQAAIAISPEQGYINTLVSVAGRDWWPGEPVFVFLRAPSEPGDRGYAYAAAVADDEGKMRAAFTFPNEMRWIGESWAEVVARGSRSGMEAATRFDLVAPTPLPTSPPPTPLPTREFTDTPIPSDTVVPTDTATPTPTPTPVPVITDWLGEYFAGTIPGGEPLLVRNDVVIDFNWGAGSPDPRVPHDQFSARWTRQIYFSEGYYEFLLSADDGIRFWIDGLRVVDLWRDGYTGGYPLTLYLPGGPHSLRLEYYENTGGAMARLEWAQVLPPTATLTPTATPTDTPTPTVTPTPTELPTQPPPELTLPPPSLPILPVLWRGDYYDNPTLDGNPVLVREDVDVHFDWGTGSPEGIPPDNFSIRWTGDQWLLGGTYPYAMSADDGARLWVDGNLVIDAWEGSGGGIVQGSITLDDGVHHFVVEYHEGIGHARVAVWGAAAR